MVFLIGSWAIKLPNLKYPWPACLWGLIHNRSEWMLWKYAGGIEGGTDHRHLLCPVIWADRWGFINIMRRAKPLPKEYNCPVFFQWLASKFKNEAGYSCPAENKMESYGLLEGEIVAIDYA
jgi:hypothetical protein